MLRRQHDQNIDLPNIPPPKPPKICDKRSSIPPPEEMKREKRQTLEAIGLDSREVLLLLILMQKLMIIQVNAVELGWLQKNDVLVSNETAMIWNSYYNTHFVVPNKRQLPNFSLIFRYLMKICQASFFWYCFGFFFPFDKLSFDPLMYFVIISSENKII